MLDNATFAREVPWLYICIMSSFHFLMMKTVFTGDETSAGKWQHPILIPCKAVAFCVRHISVVYTFTFVRFVFFSTHLLCCVHCVCFVACYAIASGIATIFDRGSLRVDLEIVIGTWHAELSASCIYHRVHVCVRKFSSCQRCSWQGCGIAAGLHPPLFSGITRM